MNGILLNEHLTLNRANLTAVLKTVAIIKLMLQRPGGKTYDSNLFHLRDKGK
jgi:hypothetical protein